MPSANTGSRKIKNIRICKDHVSLTFFKGTKIKISKEAFVSSYLYESKSLSQKEIDKLLEITAMSALLEYAIQLASKKRFSEKAMFEKLMRKENNFCASKNVINKLKEKGLLDDKAYMEDLIAYYNERNLGKAKIIKHLKDKGVPDSLIEKVSFSEITERKKAKALLPKYENKYAKYGFENKKKHIYQALLTQGFSSHVAIEIVEETKRGTTKIEKDILKKEYQKIKKRYEKKYRGYELKQKIYAALVLKGYRYQEIQTVMEDLVNENDSGF